MFSGGIKKTRARKGLKRPSELFQGVEKRHKKILDLSFFLM